MGHGFNLYWTGQTQEERSRIPYPALATLKSMFQLIGHHPEIISAYGPEVDQLYELYNYLLDKRTFEADPEAWMEPAKLLETIDKLIAGAKRRDPVIEPLARHYSDHERPKIAEEEDWEYMVDHLALLRDAVAEAIKLGAGPITFDGSFNV